MERYRSAKADIERLKGLITEVEALAEAHGIDTTKPAVQAGGISDIVGNAAAKAADILTDIREKQIEALQVLSEVEAVISMVEEPKERVLLSKKYIEGKPLEEIADEMEISRRNIWRVRERALKSADEVMERLHISDEGQS